MVPWGMLQYTCCTRNSLHLYNTTYKQEAYLCFLTTQQIAAIIRTVEIPTVAMTRTAETTVGKSVERSKTNTDCDVATYTSQIHTRTYLHLQHRIQMGYIEILVPISIRHLVSLVDH
jgi:hypothetical protein